MSGSKSNINPQNYTSNQQSENIITIYIAQPINLKQINCSNGTIQTVIFFQENYNQLQKINVANNRLKTIPQIRAQNLKYLNCQKNQIQDIEQFSQQTYSKMRSINLYSNNICILHEFLMTNLKFLYCQNNQIISIQLFAQGTYPQLITLNLSSNQLQKLPCLNTKKLQYFNCSKNQLVTIQQFSQGNYNEMQSLDLSQNKIQKLFFFSTLKLKQFNYQKNKIQVVYQRPLYESKATRSLKILKLDQQQINNIQFIQSYYLNSLKQMHLNVNHITNFYPLNKCRLLNLQKLECWENMNILFNLSRAYISKDLKITKENKLKSLFVFDRIKNKIQLRTNIKLQNYF